MLFNYVGLIRAEENRILFEMCQTISQNRQEIKEAVTAIAEIDVFRAKAKVGLRMKGIIPEVRTCSVYFPPRQINCVTAIVVFSAVQESLWLLEVE
jgi:DNA mismatch repair ATPase MutS